jgi:methyl-accepting chemotaxis protein WspA
MQALKNLFSRLTYKQLSNSILILLFLAFLPITLYRIYNHNKHVRQLSYEIELIKNETNFRKLFEFFQQQRLALNHYASGQNRSRIELLSLQNQINETMQRMLNQEKANSVFSPELSAIRIAELENLQKKWNNLNQEHPNTSSDVSYQHYDSLIQEMQNYFNFSMPINFSTHVKKSYYYYTMRHILSKLPFIQEHLSKTAFLLDAARADRPLTETQRNNLDVWLDEIEENLSILRENIDISNSNQNNQLNPDLVASFMDYQTNIEELSQVLQNEVLETEAHPASSLPLLEKIQTTQRIGSHLWDIIIHDTLNLLQEMKSSVQREFWITLLLNWLIASLVLTVGLFLIRNAGNRIQELTQTINQFSNGKWSARFPVENLNDEIGILGHEFNKMAQTMQDTLQRLYSLFNATQELASGNLAVRIPSDTGKSSELDETLIAFNTMAETFENIMRRLQHLSITLTTSATEIAAASKEQETIIVEQEATTREIAIAANEISSTAKEFANTMNEVGQTAEQTSSLALTGKESLTNMENIMHQMVEASSNIAARLAVLNEKAGNITSVITTITKVADQTNLLSLNASIEAEKAGEYGRSFAVIAREIRRLADQTAVATLDIEKIVNEIMTAVSSSVMGVDDFTQEIRNGVGEVRRVSEQLTTIIEQVQAFTARFDLVNQGMQAQSTGAEQINEAISQLSQTAQQTSESIHQFHKTIQELNHAANELRALTPSMHTSYNPPMEETPKIFNYASNRNEPPSQLNKTLDELNLATHRLKNINSNLKGSQEEFPQD